MKKNINKKFMALAGATAVAASPFITSATTVAVDTPQAKADDGKFVFSLSKDLKFTIGSNVTDSDLLQNMHVAYVEEGGPSVDYDQYLVVDTSNLNTGKVGTYDVAYKIQTGDPDVDNKPSATFTASVTIVPKDGFSSKYDEKTIKFGTTPDFMDGITAYDSIDGEIGSIQVDSSAFNPMKAGSYTVLYSTITTTGKVYKYSRVYTVAENVAPIITGAGKTITLEFGSTPTFMSGIKATDSEDGDLTSKVVVDDGGFNPTTPGTYTVKYTVKDSGGLTTEATRTYVLKEKPNEKPVIIGAGNTIELNKSSGYPDFMNGITATDKEDGDLTKSVIVNSNGFKPNVSGTYTVTYEVKDSKGLTTTATRTYVVKNRVPVISGNTDISINQFGSVDPLSGVSATDPDGDAVTLTYTGSVDPNVPGNYLITIIATDSEGSQTTATRTIHVIADTTAPTITLNYDSFTTTIGKSVNIKGNLVSAIDDNDGDVTANVKIAANGAELFDGNNAVWLKPGTYEVVYSVTDRAGNTASKKMTMVVLDKPQIIANTKVQLFKGSSKEQMMAAINGSAFDGAGNPIQLIVNGNVDLNVPGIYTLNLKAVDINGVDSQINVEVIVVDTPRKGVVILAKESYLTVINYPLDILSNIQVSVDGKVYSPSEIANITKIIGDIDYKTPGIYKIKIVVTIDDKEYIKESSVEVLSEEEALRRRAELDSAFADRASILDQMAESDKETAQTSVSNSNNVLAFAALLPIALAMGMFLHERKKGLTK